MWTFLEKFHHKYVGNYVTMYKDNKSKEQKQWNVMSSPTVGTDLGEHHAWSCYPSKGIVEKGRQSALKSRFYTRCSLTADG